MEKATEVISVTKSSGNIFADLGLPNPEEHLAKARLVVAIRLAIEADGLTQSQAAEKMGIDQPQVSRILRGGYAGYSLERLIKFLNSFGHDVEVVVRKRKSSRTGTTKVRVVS